MNETMQVWCKHPKDVFSAIADKIARRNWKCTIRQCQDGCISISYTDGDTANKIEEFLDMIIEEEYQLTR